MRFNRLIGVFLVLAIFVPAIASAQGAEGIVIDTPEDLAQFGAVSKMGIRVQFRDEASDPNSEIIVYAGIISVDTYQGTTTIRVNFRNPAHTDGQVVGIYYSDGGRGQTAGWWANTNYINGVGSSRTHRVRVTSLSLGLQRSYQVYAP